MRKGFSLIELLGVIAILTSVSLTLSLLFNTLLGDLRRTQRLIASHSRILDLLDHLRRDTDAAKSLDDSAGLEGGDPNLNQILFELADGVVCYRLSKDCVTRNTLDTEQNDDNQSEQSWTLDHAQIQWQVVRSHDRAYAVEIHTWIEQPDRDRYKKKLQNSYLFFLGAYPPSGIKL